MLQKLHVGMISFPEITLKSSEIHKARGYFSQEFKDFDLMHNHDKDTGKVIYRYPAIQFKIVENKFSIFSFGEKAIEIFPEIFLKKDEIILEGTSLKVNAKEFKSYTAEYGYSENETFLYRFQSPWIGLNQENYKAYLSLKTETEKKEKLSSIVIQNVISLCKFCGYTIPGKLNVKADFNEINVNLKGVTHLGFKGKFMMNFLLPDFIGLGKSSSRGYGWIKREMQG